MHQLWTIPENECAIRQALCIEALENLAHYVYFPQLLQLFLLF